MPPSRNSRTMSRMRRRLCGSMPTVGSSMNSSCGLWSSPAAMLTRRFMPPEKVLTLSLARSLRPTCSSTSSMRLSNALPPMS